MTIKFGDEELIEKLRSGEIKKTKFKKTYKNNSR
jgi:hypothetical protein